MIMARFDATVALDGAAPWPRASSSATSPRPTPTTATTSCPARSAGRWPSCGCSAACPFSYLVPDASLLPPESVRFFYLDRNWTDALVDGVLSIGTFTSAERIQLEALREVIRAEVDEAERTIRQPGGEERLSGPGGAISGFVMRSRLVSGWPGLHVRAYRIDRQRRRPRSSLSPTPTG